MANDERDHCYGVKKSNRQIILHTLIVSTVYSVHVSTVSGNRCEILCIFCILRAAGYVKMYSSTFHLCGIQLCVPEASLRSNSGYVGNNPDARLLRFGINIQEITQIPRTYPNGIPRREITTS